MDYGFTAGMEENLDDVAQGERDWKNVLDEFYGDFKKNSKWPKVRTMACVPTSRS